MATKTTTTGGGSTNAGQSAQFAGRLFSTKEDHIAHAYAVWKQDNPQLMEVFRSLAREVAARRAHYGIKSLAERVRWHVEVESAGEPFKINNNFCPCLARDLTNEGVVPDGFFEFRKRRAADYDELVSA